MGRQAAAKKRAKLPKAIKRAEASLKKKPAKRATISQALKQAALQRKPAAVQSKPAAVQRKPAGVETWKSPPYGPKAGKNMFKGGQVGDRGGGQ